MQHEQTKHIDMAHHFIRDHIEKGDIELVCCVTGDMLADIMTKPLARGKFESCQDGMGVI